MAQFTRIADTVDVPTLEDLGMILITSGQKRPWINNPPQPVENGHILGNLTFDQYVPVGDDMVHTAFLRVGIIKRNDGTKDALSISSYRDSNGRPQVTSAFEDGTKELIVNKWNELAIARTAGDTKADAPVGGVEVKDTGTPVSAEEAEGAE